MRGFLGRHRLLWIVPIVVWAIYLSYTLWLARVEAGTPDSAFIYDL